MTLPASAAVVETHVPLNRDAVRDAMPTFFDLLESGRRGVSYSLDGLISDDGRLLSSGWV
jgi:hypothetical protein